MDPDKQKFSPFIVGKEVATCILKKEFDFNLIQQIFFLGLNTS